MPFANSLGKTAQANMYGVPQTGNNYAIGGARSGVDIDRQGIPVASVRSQINSHLSSNDIDPNGLYVVWAGANDLFAAVDNLGNAESIIADAVASQVANIQTLHQQGAKYILMPNIPDVGLTPDYVNTPFQTIGTNIVNSFNQNVQAGATATGANIIPLDTFNLLQQVVATPEVYGFSNVSDKACGSTSSLECGRGDLVTTNANQSYFFADSVHPTGRAHKLIADYASAVVTAPSQIGVLPHLATTSGLATNQRLQTHIHQRQSQPLSTGNYIWAIGEVSSQDVLGFESAGDAQALLGIDFNHNGSNKAVTGIYSNLAKKQFDYKNSANTSASALSSLAIDEVGIGIYHRNRLDSLGGVQLNGALGVSLLDVDVTRKVTVDNFSQSFQSIADGKRYYANLQAGYPMQINTTAVTPYLGASFNRVNIDALKEEAASGIAMGFDEQEYTTTYANIGVKANYNLSPSLNAFGDIYYQTQLSDDSEAVTAYINTMPDDKFTTPMSSFDDDNIAITLGLNSKLGKLDVSGGVTHNIYDNDDATSVFVGIGGAF